MNCDKTFNRAACAVLACDVFLDELSRFGGPDGQWAAVRTLEMGLHDQPELLRGEVQSVIHQLEDNPQIETILLLYGVCGNGLIGVRSNRCRLVIPRAHDCISILMGSPEAHQAVLKENPGVYFYSPGWVRGRRVPGPDRDSYIREFYGQRYPDDEELVEDLLEADRETYMHHNCAAYVDVTGNGGAESYCRNCARDLGWQYRRLDSDPALVEDFFAGNWEADRFLVLAPGETVTDLVQGEGPPIQG